MSEQENDGSCPACGSVILVFLGILGHLEHFRCRNCGACSYRHLEEETCDSHL